MGVSGTGKSTVGLALASRLDASFVDADDLHPPQNREKMRVGTPLEDEDRTPWLERVGIELARPRSVVMACSALRRRYRDRLRTFAPDTAFIHLQGDEVLIRSRLARRQHEYMPPQLLASQLGTLEPLQPDERGITFDIAESVETIVDRAIGDL